MGLGKAPLVAATAAVTMGVAALVSPATAAGKPTVKATAPAVAENAGHATVTLKLAKKARKKIKVRFATVSGSAIAGHDFVPSSGHVVIRKHKSTATIRVGILDDTVHEGTESFVVALASKSAKLKTRNVVVVIHDDDPLPPPAPTGGTLTGTITFGLHHDEYFGDLELGSPGQEEWLTTVTLHVSLHQLGNGEWYDDGTGYWTFTSQNKLWFRRGEGVDTADNGYPFGCADDPIAVHFYRILDWYGTAGHNLGPFQMLTPSSFDPALHQANLVLTGYHPGSTGTAVLKVVAHVRPDRVEQRIADGAHICDPSTAEQPNPIVYEGDDPHLPFYDTSAYPVLIPRAGGTDGLAATFDGTGLDFSDGDILTSHDGLFNDTTGHWSHENTDQYTVTGALTLQ